MSIDKTRYYPIDYVSSQTQVKNTLSSNELVAQCEQILQRCIHHSSRRGSLYCGGLGPHVFLRMLLAQYITTRATTDNTTTSNKVDQAILLLQQAKQAAIYAFEHAQRDARVSILESRTIGAYCLLAVIDKKLEDHSPQGTHHCSAAPSSSSLPFSTSWRTLPNHIIQELSTRCVQLAPQECEVLYGRAGALAAIFYLRTELDLPYLGTEFVVETAIRILQQGMKEARSLEEHNSNNRIVGRLPLVWQWHGKHYLGGAHGVVGILHTLLNLQPIESERIEAELPNVQSIIKDTIRRLHSLCHVSGNLASSLSEQPVTLRHDRLVHWCHGATGHCLLLIKASQVFQEPTFLRAAQDIAETVVWPRGLLYKGVGLCHGISGNAFVFLALSEAVQDADAASWQGRALQYAHFALSRLSELESIPDHPYSLYEGMGGLCALLLSCAMSLGKKHESHGRAMKFPLYDF